MPHNACVRLLAMTLGYESRGAGEAALYPPLPGSMLTGIPVVETRNLRYDQMLRMTYDGRTTIAVGEFAQLQWRLKFGELLQAWRAEAFARLVAQVADIEYRLYGS